MVDQYHQQYGMGRWYSSVVWVQNTLLKDARRYTGLGILIVLRLRTHDHLV